MQSIVWSKAFSVGNSLFDSQHRRIIRIINDLIEHRDMNVASEFISEALASMTEYTINHFRDEEHFLRINNYPDIDNHAVLHRAFVEKTMNFCQATSLGVDEVPEKMLEYLKGWWLQHILEEDMQYKRYFEQNPPSIEL